MCSCSAAPAYFRLPHVCSEHTTAVGTCIGTQLASCKALEPLHQLPAVLQVHSLVYLCQWLKALRRAQHRWTETCLPSPPILSPAGPFVMWNKLPPDFHLPTSRLTTYTPRGAEEWLSDQPSLPHPLYVLGKLCTTCGNPSAYHSWLLGDLSASASPNTARTTFCLNIDGAPPTTSITYQSVICLGTNNLQGGLPLPRPSQGTFPVGHFFLSDHGNELHMPFCKDSEHHPVVSHQ